MLLSDAACRNAKLKPGAKITKLRDGGGLFLVVTPSGKFWWWCYRFGRKQKTLSLGSYPIISLSDAREQSLGARKLRAAGTDPSAAKRAGKAASAHSGTTFRAFGNDFLEMQRLNKCSEATMTKLEWLLSVANAKFGDKQAAEISTLEISALIINVVAQGQFEKARRLRSTINAVFELAFDRGHKIPNPTPSLKRTIPRQCRRNRASIADPRTFGGLLRAIEGYQGQYITKKALEFQALVFVRPGELRQSEWSEFDFDKAVWTIPQARMKMRRAAHTVPLSRQAVAVLLDVKRVTGTGRYVFPSVRTTKRPMSENTLNAALRYLGYSKETMCAHGFRGTASTLLNESGHWNPDAIERQLSHQDKDDVRVADLRTITLEQIANRDCRLSFIDEQKIGKRILKMADRRAWLSSGTSSKTDTRQYVADRIFGVVAHATRNKDHVADELNQVPVQLLIDALPKLAKNALFQVPLFP